MVADQTTLAVEEQGICLVAARPDTCTKGRRLRSECSGVLGAMVEDGHLIPVFAVQTLCRRGELLRSLQGVTDSWHGSLWRWLASRSGYAWKLGRRRIRG